MLHPYTTSPGPTHLWQYVELDAVSRLRRCEHLPPILQSLRHKLVIRLRALVVELIQELPEPGSLLLHIHVLPPSSSHSAVGAS